MLWIRLPRFRTKITFQLFASGMIMASGEWNPSQRPATFCANSSGWLLPTGVEENVQALRALNLITQNKHLLKIMSRDKAGKLGERKKKCLFQAKNKIRIGLGGRFAKDDIWTNEPWLNVGKKGKKNEQICWPSVRSLAVVGPERCERLEKVTKWPTTGQPTADRDKEVSIKMPPRSTNGLVFWGSWYSTEGMVWGSCWRWRVLIQKFVQGLGCCGRIFCSFHVQVLLTNISKGTHWSWRAFAVSDFWKFLQIYSKLLVAAHHQPNSFKRVHPCTHVHHHLQSPSFPPKKPW